MREQEIKIGNELWFGDVVLEIQRLRELDIARIEQMAADRKQALNWRDEASQAEALCQQYREALEEAIEDIASWGAYASDYFQDKWDLSGNLKKYEVILAITNPTAALNNAIAEELERLADQDAPFGWELMLENRAKELRG